MQYFEFPKLLGSIGSRIRQALIAALAMALSIAYATSVSAEGITIGLIPKFTSDPYFVAANQGAQEAAAELGVTVEFNGPVGADVTE